MKTGIRTHLYFEPKDCWIGLYWDKKTIQNPDFVIQEELWTYICLIPCYPLLLCFPIREHSYAEFNNQYALPFTKKDLFCLFDKLITNLLSY